MSDKEYINDPKDIRLNENRELQQILGNPPGWLLSWGNTFILGGAIVFLILGWLIKYPDMIPAKITLTTEQPPIRVFAETTGKLSDFKIQNNENVEQGQVLAELENPANLKDVEALDSFLVKIQNMWPNPEILKMDIPRNLRLGGIQGAYASFSKSFDEHVYFLKDNNTLSKVSNFKKQISRLKELGQSLERQIVNLEQEVDLSEKNFERSKKLKENGDISDMDLEMTESAFLRSQRELETLRNKSISNNLEVAKMELQIMETRRNNKEGKSSGVLAIQEDIQKMQSQLGQWKKNFLILAPIAGQVSLIKFTSSQQYINQNQELLTIVPATESEIIGKVYFLGAALEKVRPNMVAKIRLDGYPYQEFGSVEGKVNSISLVPQGEGYIVEFSVPQPLMTNYHEEITFQQEMEGTANIITEDRRILERIFDRILNILRN